jgi:phosphoribosylformylglycinamidine cyclo-ligase
MGIGYILVVSQADADSTVQSLAEMGEKAYLIGSIEKGEGAVRLVD